MYGNQAQQWPRLLYSALRHDTPRLACDLIQHGVDLNAKVPYESDPPLSVAVQDCPDAVQCLLDRGVDINGDRGSPLARAASTRRLAVARLLLERGANVNANAGTVFEPLIFAIQNKDIPMVRLLLEHGAVVDVKHQNGKDANLGFRPLSSAVTSRNADILKLLLARGVGSAAKSDALREAIAFNHRDMFQLLLAQGAAADVHSFAWQSLLRSAQQFRDVNQLAMLQQAGMSTAQEKAGLNAKNAQGQTAFLIALAQGKTEQAQTLLAQGADVNVQDIHGETPLTEAIQHCPALVPILLARGANIKVVTQPLGLTPLHLAVNADDQQMARLLLKRGADPNACPPRGHTPLYRARRHNQTAMYQILREAGATIEK